MSDRI